MVEKSNEKNSEKIPERPLECTECKKTISFYYTEVVGSSVNKFCMCSDCPELQKKLHGTPGKDRDQHTIESKTGLACGNCGTTLDSIRVGASMGCSECYQVFEDIILPEIQASGKLPMRLENVKKTLPIHMGRAPGKTPELNPSLRLLALNEALSDTLKREDYEQAAWLRDQIKAITETSENKNEERKP